MEHLGTKRLETKRLILRRFTLEDAAPMYRNWGSDSEVTAYLTWPTHSSLAISQMVLDQWIKDYKHLNHYQWAIALKEDEWNPIGSIGANYCDEDTRMAHLGYCTGKAWWHRGIVSEALQCVITYLLDEVGLNRVEAKHDVNNPNSGAVMKKCGMQYEGTLRQAGCNNQGICDMSYYGVLASDWN
ncbi:GNAT family N-acetyltransferase [uncultured Vagococcus sp.]|uniref:GNAT family N-acetyltransferase n=1 Tax=uncultured Vagococcus sp. TaxID=189676 RepID=UPI0028D4957E|nr:GNAT family N-acetyltransferase [uncultured Vagococcus sp.]